MIKRGIIGIIIVLLAFIGYNYIYQGHRDIQKEVAEFSIDATEMANEFSINPTTAESNYLNKTIEISGTISETNKTEIILNNSIICLFNKDISENKPEKEITIKGRFIGYDDLLEQLKLDQCSIIN